MNNELSLLSAGIDIGTTTTQIVFSLLNLQESSAFGRVPTIAVTNRAVLYKGPIHLTPLTADGAIDAGAVACLVKKDYAGAGYRPDDIQTGAVIITGESARKRNASEVLHAISALAGDFVAAEAGPDLESILAGRGAGADRISETRGKSVLNIDIGGGTSNLCLFKDGRPIACSACNIGARAFSEKDPEAAESLCSRLASALASIAGLSPLTPFAQSLLIPGEKTIPERADVISFSGGVAACMAEDRKKAYSNLFPYGDLGLLLARAIWADTAFSAAETIFGEETVRATVTGAASFSMEVSGSTVFCRDVSFPLKNIPVFALSYNGSEDISGLRRELKRIQKSAKHMQLTQYALALRGFLVPSFQEVEFLANELAALLSGTEELAGNPGAQHQAAIPILLESDFAKALGQALKRRLPTGPILCLDGIAVDNENYIDIGAPLAGGLAYPVTVKTLLFN